MGSQSKPNHGVLMGAIVYLLAILSVNAQEVEESGLEMEANELWKAGAYYCGKPILRTVRIGTFGAPNQGQTLDVYPRSDD